MEKRLLTPLSGQTKDLASDPLKQPLVECDQRRWEPARRRFRLETNPDTECR
jgi:hypothetical protein